MLLADYGASVLRIDGPPSPRGDVLARHKFSISLDLKDASSREVLLSLVAQADVLIDPFRPEVLERLELSPADVLLKLNPRLIVARLTGFRRDGEYKDMAGHDINYLAVSGVLSMLGRATESPYAPGNMLGDFAGGGMMCAVGILLALVSRQTSGLGQVVENNMVDGSAYLATMPRLTTKMPFWGAPRGQNTLDGGCPWYDTYEAKDRGQYVAVGALEPRFYDALLHGLGLSSADLPSRDNKDDWPSLRAVFASKFKERTRREWELIFGGTGPCVSPVLQQDQLEQRGFDQRLPVSLSQTPGKPIAPEIGGWSGGSIAQGHRGEKVLHQWLGWEKGADYQQSPQGFLTKASKAKL
uniref:Alpha-methylacyl-CoA racemase n=1 Tax=Kallichroma tethys TaxID=110573 RepID=Q8NJ71_9HYPO|nr:unknown [Kallichroma tethys]